MTTRTQARLSTNDGQPSADYGHFGIDFVEVDESGEYSCRGELLDGFQITCQWNRRIIDDDRYNPYAIRIEFSGRIEYLEDVTRISQVLKKADAAINRFTSDYGLPLTYGLYAQIVCQALKVDKFIDWDHKENGEMNVRSLPYYTEQIINRIKK